MLVLHTDGFGGQGGIAAFVRNLLEALCSFEKTEVIHALPRKIYESVGVLPPKLRYHVSAAASTISYLRALLGLLRSGDSFDLVVCAHLHLLPLAYLASWRNRCPLVLVIYGIDAWNNPQRKLVSLALPKVDEVWSISRFTTDCFREWANLHDRATYRILECAVDLDTFKREQNPRPGEVETLRLLSITRLSSSERYKGIDEVLELIAHDSRLTYVICGEGDDREHLMRKAEELQISNRVEFLGYVSEEVKRRQLHAADVFVLLSQREGFGIVFIEAMSAGLPVVACRRAGAIETLRNGKLGLLVEPDDRQGLQEAVWQAYRQGPPSREMLEDFSLNQFNRHVHTFVEGLVKK